jgi:hypothetical protein
MRQTIVRSKQPKNSQRLINGKPYNNTARLMAKRSFGAKLEAVVYIKHPLFSLNPLILPVTVQALKNPANTVLLYWFVMPIAAQLL